MAKGFRRQSERIPYGQSKNDLSKKLRNTALDHNLKYKIISIVHTDIVKD